MAPFNSQIKLHKDKFFIVDLSNTLRCFSIKDGKELWNIETENSLIRSQKKLSMVIVNNVLYFKNSIGDISAVELNEGELIWQIPTQSNLIYQSAFSLETSEIISDSNNLFFSNQITANKDNIIVSTDPYLYVLDFKLTFTINGLTYKETLFNTFSNIKITAGGLEYKSGDVVKINSSIFKIIDKGLAFEFS